jgi:hypothetical protein
VTGTTGQAGSIAARLGLQRDSVVGEIGYDEDVDAEVRAAIESATGSELLDEDADDVLDAVLLWWRSDDGDLTDALVDAITLLADDGVIALLTPRTGRPGYVEPSEIAEATQTAGLAQTTSAPGGPNWILTKLARSRSRQSRR